MVSPGFYVLIVWVVLILGFVASDFSEMVEAGLLALLSSIIDFILQTFFSAVQFILPV